jgi:hypothetical protein
LTNERSLGDDRGMRLGLVGVGWSKASGFVGLLPALLVATVVVSQATAGVVTPGHSTAVVIAPFSFDVAFQGADNKPDVQPAVNALKGEGYDVKVFAPTSIGGAGSPTVQDFVDSSDKGVLVISSHGACVSPRCSYNGIVLQVFKTEAEADAAKKLLLDNHWTDDEVKIGEVSVKTEKDAPLKAVYDLDVTTDGIKKHWKSKGAFVYLMSCCGFSLESAFKSVGAAAVFGYKEESTKASATDASLFWRDMDGTRHGGATVGKLSRQSTTAYDELKAINTIGDPTITRDPAVVLAPSVGSVKYTSSEKDLSQGAELNVKITFDTPMNTNTDPPRLLTVKGCGSDLRGVGSPSWSTDGLSIKNIMIHTEPSSAESHELTLTVSGEKTTSLNGQKLDGNQNPKPQSAAAANDASAVAPVGDNFVWTLDCGKTAPPPVCPPGEKKGPMIRHLASSGDAVACTYTFTAMCSSGCVGTYQNSMTITSYSRQTGRSPAPSRGTGSSSTSPGR